MADIPVQAGKGKLNLHDIIKGLITAIGTAILTGLYTSVTNGSLPHTPADFKTMGLVGIGAGISYLGKNVLTNSNDVFLGKEPPKPE